MRIAIEGLIGVGKSTVLDILRNKYMLHVEPEPLDAWTLLPQFYRNKPYEAFAFEMQVLSSYCHSNFSGSIVMERSPDTAKDVFVPMLYRDGSLTSTQYQLLNQAAAAMPSLNWADAFVYIRAPTHVCLQRLAWRNRGNESSSVTETYLQRLSEAYDAFFDAARKTVVILDLDGTEGPEEVARQVHEMIEAMRASYTAAYA